MDRPDPNGRSRCGSVTCPAPAARADCKPIRRGVWDPAIRDRLDAAINDCNTRPAVDWQAELCALLAGDGMGLAEEAERRTSRKVPHCSVSKPRDMCAECLAVGLAAALRLGGVDLIAAERRRQVSVEGWTAEHDNEHAQGELAMAAASYAIHGNRGDGHPWRPPAMWPWDAEWWKPTPDDRVRELVKAGALIAAEIERLQRALPEGA